MFRRPAVYISHLKLKYTYIFYYNYRANMSVAFRVLIVKRHTVPHPAT